MVYVWNEDLVNAMNARHQQAWQQQRQSQYKWRDGAKTIEAVRKDIRLTSTGKIFNLPTQNNKTFAKTVYEECIRIIKGEAPIYPPGYTPLTPAGRKTMEASAFLPYIEQLKRESGGYAILLAFHVSQRDTLSKDEICKIGQDYCKEQMSENYHAGRMFGAWKGNETLARHGLITIHRAGARYTERGFRSNGKNTYMITADGKKAIQQILKKWPDINIRPRALMRSPRSAAGAISTASPNDVNLFGAARDLFSHVHTPLPVKRNAKSADDEKELRDWIESTSTSIGAQKVFKVGKDRRLFIHRLCDQLQSENPGLRLEHQSVSEGQRRHLYITLRGKQQNSGYASVSSTPVAVKSARRVLDFSDERQKSAPMETKIKHKRPHATISISDGHTLLGSCDGKNSIKKPRSAKVAAGQAALARLEKQKPKRKDNASSSVNLAKSSPVIEILSDGDSEPRHKPSHKKPQKVIFFNSNTKEEFYDYQPGEFCRLRAEGTEGTRRGPFKILRVHIDGYITVKHPSYGEWKVNAQEVKPCDSEVQIVTPNLDAKQKSKSKTNTKTNTKKGRTNQSIRNRNGIENEVIELLDEGPIEIAEAPNKGKTRNPTATGMRDISILIDDRERSRNHKPREMRIELTKEVQNPCWKNVSSAAVQERKLLYGDFAFEVTGGNESKLLSVSIERKRVADLIQRSASGEHWKQLGRMRDNCQHAIMLIEGDSKVAHRFDPYGIQHAERKLSHHTIEHDEDLFVFAGRSIISSRKIKFVQTRDERGTYRSVIAIGMVANASPKINLLKNEKPPAASTAQSRLKDILISGGVDWRVAQEISFQFGGVKCLEDLYNSCNSIEAKRLLMEPIIRNLDEKQLGRIDSWSRTIFEVFTTTDKDRAQKRRQYEDIKSALGEGACDYPALLYFLYREQSPDGALNAALDYTSEPYSTEQRKVLIKCSQTLISFFEPPGDKSFYKLSLIHKTSSELPVVKFSTVCENMRSNEMFVYVLDGSDLVKDVCQSLKVRLASETFIGVGKRIAESINDKCKSECDSAKWPARKSNHCEHRVILIRGLNPAISKAAKSSDYLIETSQLCDVTMASLMVDHDIVVLQAIRKDISETTMILRQIALACYHYHLLPNDING